MAEGTFSLEDEIERRGERRRMKLRGGEEKDLADQREDEKGLTIGGVKRERKEREKSSLD